MLKLLTKNYISAFSNRNIDGVASLLDPNVVLEDPVVKRFRANL